MKQGIFTMSEEMYHSDKIGSEITLSNSIAKIIIQQSPQHAWYAHPRLNPRHQSVDSDRFDLVRVFRNRLSAPEFYVVVSK